MITINITNEQAHRIAGLACGALDQINEILPSDDEWDGPSGRLEDIASILRSVRKPVRHSSYEAH